MARPLEIQNPREGANWLSIILFWWMNDVLKLGNKRPLTEEDLFHLLKDFKAEVLVEDAEKYWFEELKRSQSRRKKPRLWKAMVSLINWKSGLVMIILKTLQSLSFVSLPLCLWLVLKTLNDGPNLDLKSAFIYVALLGLTSLIKALTTQHYDYLTELWGLKLKVALIGLVYKKVSGSVIAWQRLSGISQSEILNLTILFARAEPIFAELFFELFLSEIK